MMRCPHCGWTTRSGIECDRCTASLVHAGAQPARPEDGEFVETGFTWATVARFGNAAEAGYFAHELAPLLNFEPRIEYQDDFDAIGGAWRTRYLLAVPDRLAEQARRHLATMLDGNWEHDPSQPFSDDTFDEPGSGKRTHLPQSRINWVPIMLTLAAGSAVLWAGRKINVARGNVAPGEAGQRDLFEILSDGARPWVQQSEDGRREFRINSQSGTATVLEDTDGDGRFDRRLEFQMRSR